MQSTSLFDDHRALPTNVLFVFAARLPDGRRSQYLRLSRRMSAPSATIDTVLGSGMPAVIV